MKAKTKKTENKPVEESEDEPNWIVCQTCGSIWGALPNTGPLRLMMCPLCADDCRDE